MKRHLAVLATLLLLALAMPVAAVPVAAQQPPQFPEVNSARVVPIQITGPPSQRLNFVLMGDGYQAHELDTFREDVDRNLAVMWTIEPFRSYRNYINIYAMELVSQDSGTRCDPDVDNAFIDTPLRLGFAANCPAGPLARGVQYRGALQSGTCPGIIGDPRCSGAQQRNMYLNEYMAPVLGVPSGNIQNLNNLQTLAIFNSFTYGGIGGQHATTSGGSPQGPLVSVHELGHSTGNNYPDEYPYSSRDVGPPQRACYSGNEPPSFNHTLMSSEEMIANEAKWHLWLGEESEAGGLIKAADPDGWEGGLTRPCGVWRPSQHSIMRWIGFYFDQPGREHMVGRISGMRFANQMPMSNLPEGEVGPSDVVWVETLYPKYHEIELTWRINGEVVDIPGNARYLHLDDHAVSAGDVVQATVHDPTEFVRDPGLASGPRMTQTRQWTVGAPLPASDADVAFTLSTQTVRPVDGQEIVYVETEHPTDRVFDVTWRLDGEVVPNPHSRRVFNIADQDLPAGTYELSATVTDPADPGGASDTLTWTIDNVLPTAPRTLSESLTTLDGDLEHPVYFDGWDMLLEPDDDRTGYDEDLFVVGELRLNEDGWFNYFGFPEEPHGTPFKFRHSGSDVKALTYGNLGKGGLSKATFEQYFTEEHPTGPFEPGYGTHFVEHRAIDPAGNIGEAEAYRATVLPGGSPECTTTVSGTRNGRLVVAGGVTCLDGARVNGGVTVRPGASLVVSDGSRINGGLRADGAAVVQVFGADVHGDTVISGATDDVILAGSRFTGSLMLTDNTGFVTTILSGDTREYGVLVIGNDIGGDLVCSGNTPHVNDFDAPNRVGGSASGQCAGM